MTGTVNKIFLVGHLGGDPEIRSFERGGRIASFSVATSDDWKTADGEKKSKVQWHSVSVLNEALADICGKHLRKGSRVHIEGALEHREYEKDGRTVKVSEVVLRPYRGELVMLDGPKGRNEPQP